MKKNTVTKKNFEMFFLTITFLQKLIMRHYCPSNFCRASVLTMLFALLFAQQAIAAPKVVISGFLANPGGTDSPYEYVQLIAVENVDFSATPHSVVVCNNGTATSNGWASGAALSYGFNIISGTLNAGDVAYVGGSGKLISGSGSADISGATWLKAIDTATTAGDGFGNSSSGGVFGNGGGNADGVAVFDLSIGSVTSATVPIDAVFFGTAVGTAKPASGGYILPDNDRYSNAQGAFGNGTNTYLFPDAGSNQFIKLAGSYNTVSQTWTTQRTGSAIALTTSSTLADIATAITFGGGGGAPTPQKIHDVQGNGTASPLLGSQVIVEGIVVGDFQSTTNGLSGFFLQEEDGEADADPLTSEGIFVYDNSFGVDVNLGDRVSVTGTVAEYFNLTEITTPSAVSVISTGNPSPAVTDIALPFADATFLERYEGMYVRLSQNLTVSDSYELHRYGELVVSNGRLMQPTNIAAPGTAANNQQTANNLNMLTIDDGRSGSYKTPYVNNFTANNPIRVNSNITNITGLLSYEFSKYRLHPTSALTFTGNARTASPDNVGGMLKVASFNVLNYFVTTGSGSICGPLSNQGCRGATNASELTRQRNKLISALVAIDADIFGFMELENHPSDNALIDIVNLLNAATASGTYSRINTSALGDDVIKVGLIYKSSRVTPVGAYQKIDITVNPNFDSTRNRVSLAQTFSENSSGQKFTVVVNHLKSKGSCGEATGLDTDQGDGQSCWNDKRNKAAQALVDWLATDPTGSNDPDFLIMGDLNSYALEDPITTIKNAGYTELINARLGQNAYSFLYFGQVGYLDHALASASLAPQVTGVAEWHINTDEQRNIDYNEENLPSGGPAKPADFYNADSYRSSDHDPVIIGLTLGSSSNPKDKRDINGDGYADILWQNADNTAVVWFMNSSGAMTSGSTILGPSSFTIKAAGDINGDGYADILWQNSADNTAVVWFMNSSGAMTSGSTMLGPSSFVIKAVSDINGDGFSDILWQDSADNTAVIWFMNSSGVMTSGSTILGPSTWEIKGK